MIFQRIPGDRLTRTIRAISLPLVLLIACATHEAQTTSPSLAELQRAYAMRYLEPEPHMVLAKYYFDHGNRLEAFFIVESARRGHFEKQVFNPAFYRAFDGFDNSKAAETRLLAEFARDPKSLETLDGLADIYISREDYVSAQRYLLLAIERSPEDFKFTGGLARVLGAQGKQPAAEQLIKDYARKFPETADGYAIRAEELGESKKPAEARLLLAEGLKRFPTSGRLMFDQAVSYQTDDKDKAEEAFVKAAELSPKSELIQSWVGRFFFKIRSDNRRALDYYLSGYFLNPDAYESEFVESRIRNIASQLAAQDFEKQVAAGVSLTKLLADPNPIVAALAIERMSEEWSPAYVGPLVQMLGHEDAGARWEATELLKTKVDASFDAQLRALLKDDDLRKRGLAAYIAVHRWKNDSFAIMQTLLADESQLVRFDAISALIMEGGPDGRKVALAHKSHEPNAALKKIIETAPEKYEP